MKLVPSHNVRMVTRGIRAWGGSVLTVLSIKTLSALSRTELRILESLLCSPCTNSWARVSVFGDSEGFEVVESRDNRSWK